MTFFGHFWAIRSNMNEGVHGVSFKIKEFWHFLDIFEQLEAIWMRDEGVPIYSPTPSKLKKSWKENRTFSRSDHCNDPFPNYKLHIQIIIIWYHASIIISNLFLKTRIFTQKYCHNSWKTNIFSFFWDTDSSICEGW